MSDSPPLGSQNEECRLVDCADRSHRPILSAIYEGKTTDDQDGPLPCGRDLAGEKFQPNPLGMADPEFEDQLPGRRSALQIRDEGIDQSRVPIEESEREREVPEGGRLSEELESLEGGLLRTRQSNGRLRGPTGVPTPGVLPRG